MITETFHRRLSPQDFAAVVDAAKARAAELRREAIRDFWLAVERGVRSAWRAIGRRAPASRPGSRSARPLILSPARSSTTR